MKALETDEEGVLLDLGGRFAALNVLFFSPFNRVVDFSPMDRDLFGGFNAKANFIAANFHNDDGDVVIDDDAFVFLPREN